MFQIKIHVSRCWCQIYPTYWNLPFSNGPPKIKINQQTGIIFLPYSLQGIASGGTAHASLYVFLKLSFLMNPKLPKSQKKTSSSSLSSRCDKTKHLYIKVLNKTLLILGIRHNKQFPLWRETFYSISSQTGWKYFKKKSLPLTVNTISWCFRHWKHSRTVI